MTEDFWGAMERCLEFAQSEKDERWEFIACSDWGMEGEEWRLLKSSA